MASPNHEGDEPLETQHWTNCPCGEGIGVTDAELETDFGQGALATWIEEHRGHGAPTTSERLLP